MTLTVIINTFERPETLVKCLSSLRAQNDQEFLLLVIDQSENQKTKELCDREKIRLIFNHGRNLSVSRNIGLLSCNTDLVAFIDDDAVAMPDWVGNIKNRFSQQPELAVLGGRVIGVLTDNNEYVQFQNGIVSDYGYIEDIHPANEDKYINGYDHWYARPMGTNMTFKLKSVLAAGGFDEYYEYNHEETDLVLRMIRQGFQYVYADEVVVKHFNAPGINRADSYNVNWYVNIKNNAYFGMKNGKDLLPLRIARVLKRAYGEKGGFSIVNLLARQGKISAKKNLQYQKDMKAGLFKGLQDGLFSHRKLINNAA